MDLIWEYYIHLLQAMHIPLFSRPIRIRPHNRNRSDKFLRTELDFEIFAAIMILVFSATFTCAWNFYFPSTTERILWRCSCVFFLVYAVIGGFYTWIWHLLLLDKYKAARLSTIEMGPVDPRQHKGIENRSRALASKMGKALLHEAPNSNIPLSLLLPVSILCALYCLFRAYILIEDAISLRVLPSSAYATVNWSQYIPHI
jgi:hypothetical protein